MNISERLENLLIQESGTILMDGGLATELEAFGVILHEKLWSAYSLISNPELIQKVHEAYIEAGSRIITTATYQASVQGFLEIGLTNEEIQKVMNRGIDLAHDARINYLRRCDKQFSVLIAVSMGPYGATIPGGEYSGTYAESINRDVIENFHIERLNMLANHEHCDILLFETIPSAIEAKIIAELAQKLEILKPIFISFSCRNERQLCSGENLESILQTLNNFEQVVGVGINCTNPIFIESLVSIFRKSSLKKFFIAYPNSGEIYDPTSKSWLRQPTTDEADLNFSKMAKSWSIAGANIIGGCCRTSAKTIKTLQIEFGKG